MCHWFCYQVGTHKYSLRKEEVNIIDMANDRTLDSGLVQQEEKLRDISQVRPKIWKVYSRRKKVGPGNEN